MAFTVHVANEPHPYGDEDVYQIRDNRLKVEPKVGGKVITYNLWIYLEADDDHKAGYVKGAKKSGAGRAAFVS